MSTPRTILETLAAELHSNLESLGSMVRMAPIQRGASWANFSIQVSDGRVSRTFTVSIEEEGAPCSSEKR